MATADPVHDAAREYLRRGWQVVRILPGTKKCIEIGWQHSKIAETEIPKYFYLGAGIGIVLGDPSGGLADVDLDDLRAVALGPAFLPESGLVHGHQSKRNSHFYYIVPGVETKRFKDTVDSMVVELRGTGCYTVVPPTPHESGEPIEWSRYGDPLSVTASELRLRVTWLATCVLLSKHWAGEGSRHAMALAAGGYLLRLEVPVEWAIRIVACAAQFAGDKEFRDRARAVSDTAAALEHSEPATGGPTLTSLVGDDVVDRLQDWLGHRDAGETRAGQTERVVDVTVQHLPDQTRQAWEAVQAANVPPQIFIAGGMLSRIARSPHGEISLRPMSPDDLRHTAARTAHFVRWVQDERRDVYPPMAVIKDWVRRSESDPVCRSRSDPPGGTAILLDPGHSRSQPFVS